MTDEGYVQWRAPKTLSCLGRSHDSPTSRLRLGDTPQTRIEIALLHRNANRSGRHPRAPHSNFLPTSWLRKCPCCRSDVLTGVGRRSALRDRREIDEHIAVVVDPVAAGRLRKLARIVGKPATRIFRVVREAIPVIIKLVTTFGCRIGFVVARREAAAQVLPLIDEPIPSFSIPSWA